MTTSILRGDARHLPLPDGSVDLVVTSPPYFGLRSYTDSGEHYDGQIGSEATPREWLAAMLECTAEWIRVLKPSGSIFVNLGDKYADGGRGAIRSNWSTAPLARLGPLPRLDASQSTAPKLATGGQPKSLLGLPWRYALACMDDLGLILRRDIIWSKPNGLPESVTDRCRSSHEYLFHLVKQPRYYAAVDEIREAQAMGGNSHTWGNIGSQGGTAGEGRRTVQVRGWGQSGPREYNPLGKLPGSVWDIPEGEPAVRLILRAMAAGAITIEEAERLLTPELQDNGPSDVWDIPSQPLKVPESLGVNHFAAFPCEMPRRCIHPPACPPRGRPSPALSSSAIANLRITAVMRLERDITVVVVHPNHRFADGAKTETRTAVSHAGRRLPGYTKPPLRRAAAPRLVPARDLRGVRRRTAAGQRHHARQALRRRQQRHTERHAPPIGRRTANQPAVHHHRLRLRLHPVHRPSGHRRG